MNPAVAPVCSENTTSHVEGTSTGDTPVASLVLWTNLLAPVSPRATRELTSALVCLPDPSCASSACNNTQRTSVDPSRLLYACDGVMTIGGRADANALSWRTATSPGTFQLETSRLKRPGCLMANGRRTNFVSPFSVPISRLSTVLRRDCPLSGVKLAADVGLLNRRRRSQERCAAQGSRPHRSAWDR